MNPLKYILTFIPFILFGQSYEKTISSIDTFYILGKVDSLTIPKNLPDGKWKVFFDNDTTRPHFIFHLASNKVDGYFKSFYQNGSYASIGNYKNDSLWTFRTDEFGGKDTTFKVALWRYQTLNFVKDKRYKIPFKQNDSVYHDIWYYDNSLKLCERVYHRTKGLIKELWYWENGKPSSLFEKANQYSMQTKWTKDQKVESIYLDQKLSFQLELDTSNSMFWIYDRCSECAVQQTFDRKGNLISTVSINKNEKIKSFYGGGVTLRYNDAGKIEEITYRKKNKLKHLRIK